MQSEQTGIVRVRLLNSGMYHLRLLARPSLPVSTSAPTTDPIGDGPAASSSGTGALLEWRYEAVCRLMLVARNLAPIATLSEVPPASSLVIGPIGAQPELLSFHLDPVINCPNGKDCFLTVSYTSYSHSNRNLGKSFENKVDIWFSWTNPRSKMCMKKIENLSIMFYVLAYIRSNIAKECK